MAHRTQQIVDAVETAHRANANLRAEIEVDNERSLSEEDGQLPAHTINYADTPDGDSDLGSWHRVVNFALTSFATGASKREVREALFEIQRQAHIAMMTNFGLAFVWEVTLGDMPRPTIQKHDRWVGSLTSNWAVRYIMNISDPG